MKKWLAALMALVMITGCVPGSAASYTVDEKFLGQAQNQALTGEIGFLVTGDSSAAMDSALFETLGHMLPETEMTFGITLYPKAPRGGYVTRKGADGSEKTVQLLFDDQTLAFGGDAIAAENTYYIMNTGVPAADENRVPGMADILQMIEGAEESWKERAQDSLGYYQAMLSIWMNEYAGATMGKADDVLYSELSCTIPAAAVKEQVKTMLHAFYTDQQTLQLLMEVMKGTGAEIYLNPAMESVFCMLVDEVQLTGDLTVVRRFDSQGALLLDKFSLPLNPMELPFFPGVKWQRISLEMTGRGDFSFTLEGTAGENVHFSLNKPTEGMVSGRLVLDLPGEDGGLQHTGYTYEGTWQAMEETYTLQTDLCERLMQGTLTLTPDEKTEAPRQQMTLDVRFTTSSGKRDPSFVEANLVWADLEGDATIAVVLTAKTAKPFDVQNLDAIENKVPFQALTEDEQTAVLQQIMFMALDQAALLPE
ncbi:MAG: hypothetical protein IJO67_08540 [Clostridia bacterium]|nr:hypothetical protein [Clostridia bacterium]